MTPEMPRRCRIRRRIETVKHMGRGLDQWADISWEGADAEGGRWVKKAHDATANEMGRCRL